MQRIVSISVFLLLLSGWGCSQPSSPLDLASTDPAIKIETMKKIVADRTSDPDTLRQLVAQLGNDDGAVRLYAIFTLKELTGKTFDYKYYASREQREQAITAWKQWLADRERPDNRDKPDQPRTTVSGTGG